ncbi:protein ROOT INITIATION DEFECTIVE 3-like [Magnolia sinica]|uniref:protein ROOT INITIATION DEFECTIVE 3-like n=1 Tax=Magnolia sinica TaxID=86752 RepID=UPI002658D94C|nr:protein ROOT INITIATION DEFECTIVE 3-like [Magnolia sinica]
MASSSWEIFLASSPEGPITAYDANTGNALAYFSNGSRSSPRKGLTLAGKTLIATSHIPSTTTSSSMICLYNWWSSAPFRHLPVPEPVAPLAATPDGLYLFCGGLSGQIHTLSLPSGDLLRSSTIHRRPITCLKINSEVDGSLLISGGDDGAIAVLSIMQLLDSTATTPSEDNSSISQLALHHFPAHSSSVTAIESSVVGCNTTIVSCSLDCTCKFWSLASGAHMRTVRFPCVIWCVAMDPTMSEFYAGGADGRVYVGKLKVVSRRRQLSTDRDADVEVATWAQEHNGAVTALAMANQDQCLVSASEDGSIKVWEVESGKVIRVVGQERSNGISDLVVAKGIASSNSGFNIRRNDGAVVRAGDDFGGFSGREIAKQQRPVKEVMEMEECLGVVVKDRRRAIETLEGAIGTYERLLTLFLNEAK